MNRIEKESEVAQLRQMFQDANGVFLVKYGGLSVSQLESLRGDLRKKSAVFRVAKARLMKIAAGDDEGAEALRKNFSGQVALVFALSEVPSVAKQLVTFGKDHNSLGLVAGYFEDTVLDASEVEGLASIPSRPELLAQVAGVLQAPIAAAARVLNAPLVQLATALGALVEKRG